MTLQQLVEVDRLGDVVARAGGERSTRGRRASPSRSGTPPAGRRTGGCAGSCGWSRCRPAPASSRPSARCRRPGARPAARTPSVPLSAYSTVMPCSSSALVSAKTLRTSSSTISTVAPSSWARRDRGAPAGPAAVRSGGRGRRDGSAGALPATAARRRDHRSRCSVRQVQGEGRALAGADGDGDGAAEQPGHLPADRQPQPGAAVLAAGRAVGLLERLEDESQLVVGDADAGVADGEPDDLVGAVERRRPRRPRSARPVRSRSVTSPLSVNFTALESRLRSTCCSRCASVTHAGAAPCAIDRKSSPFSSASGANAARRSRAPRRCGPRSARCPSARPRSWTGRGCR